MDTNATDGHDCTTGQSMIPSRAIDTCTFQYFQERIARKINRNGRAYAPSSEKPPSHVYFQSVNQTRIDETLHSLQDLVSRHLDAADDQNKDYELLALKAMTNRLSAISYENGITALFMGAQAGGKSSLINGLLDSKEEICDTGEGSRAVTTCPASFQSGVWHATDNESMYTAVVRFLNKTDIESAVKYYAQNVATYSLSQGGSLFEDPETDDNAQIENVGDLYEDAKAFAIRLEAINTTKLEGSVDQMIARGSEEYSEMCQTWFQAAINNEMKRSTTKASNGPNRIIVCEDVEALKQGIEEYTAGPLSMITRCIDVKLRAPILRSGLRILDLPGLNDIDISRNATTQSFIESGAIRIICARPMRIETDASIQSELRRSINAVGHENTYLIITQIDTNLDVKKIRNIEPYKSLSKMFTENQTQIEEIIEAQIDTNSTEFSDSEDEGPRRPQDALTHNAKSEEQRLREDYAKWLRGVMDVAIINYNCEQLKTSLNEKYPSKTDGATINIFFTSAGDYSKSLTPQSIGNRPNLYGAASGVPELRRHLIGLTGPGRLASLQRHAENDLIVWFRNLDRICVKDGAQTDMNELHKLYISIFDDWQKSKKDALTQHLKSELDDMQKRFLGSEAEQDRTCALIKATADGWRLEGGLHHQTFALICRKGGKVERRVCGLTHSHDWVTPINDIFERPATQWNIDALVFIDRITQDMLREIDQHDVDIKRKLPHLAIHLKNRNTAESDWRRIRAATKRAIETFRDNAKRAARLTHEALTNTDGSQPSAAVAEPMRSVLRSVDDLFLEHNTRSNTHVVMPPPSRKSASHDVKMSDFVSRELSNTRLIRGVSWKWHHTTKDKLAPIIEELVTELQNISDQWRALIEVLRPITQNISPKAMAVRDAIKEDIEKIRAMVNEVGSGVLLKETLAP